MPFSIDTIALYFQRFVWKGWSSDRRLHRQLPGLPKSGDAARQAPQIQNRRTSRLILES
jgi:hypothetical protein